MLQNGNATSNKNAAVMWNAQQREYHVSKIKQIKYP